MWDFALLIVFCRCDAVNKIPPCGVEVMSNPTGCDGCVYHLMVFCEMKLFAVLWFLV